MEKIFKTSEEFQEAFNQDQLRTQKRKLYRRIRARAETRTNFFLKRKYSEEYQSHYNRFLKECLLEEQERK